MARILLLLARRENATLLAQALQPHYEVCLGEQAEPEERKADLQADFDLCILDGQNLERYGQALSQRREAAAPLFLPVLLIATRDKIGMATRQIWQRVDDAIAMPLEKAELQARVAVLLRCRQFSLELQQSNLQLQEMNRLKSQFVSMVSHEFRNPLSAVKGLVQLLEQRGDRLPAEKRQSHLQRILTSVQRLTDLVDDVLVMGRIGVGKLVFRPAPLDLDRFCRLLLEEMKLSTSQPQPLVFDRQGEAVEGTTEGWFDRDLLHHIFSNLLSNAMKYSPADSPIALTLQYQRDHVIFQVKDRGRGIPVADRAHLFEPFHRASNVGNTSGTGLGLTVVKQCVELHGGQIAVTSEIDTGTTVEVSLPWKTAASYDTAATGTQP